MNKAGNEQTAPDANVPRADAPDADATGHRPLPPGSPAAHRTTPASHDASPRIAFDDVACGSQQVQIEYRGQIYYLRTTRNGKLILNK